MRPDGGADTKPDGPGVHAGAKIHLYHCDHRGLPLALVSTEGATEWCAEYDEWGNLLNEENPHQLQQLIRLPGQQYDEESGLYYNRHRYYDPLQGGISPGSDWTEGDGILSVSVKSGSVYRFNGTGI